MAGLRSHRVRFPHPRWSRLGVLPVERVPLWAAHWLADGHDGDDLVMLAGFTSRDDPRDIRGQLPAALADCGVAIPGSDAAAAQAAFTYLARMHTDGQAAERWILDKVGEIVTRAGYADSACWGLVIVSEACLRYGWEI
jgi:hypothetical protein